MNEQGAHTTTAAASDVEARIQIHSILALNLFVIFLLASTHIMFYFVHVKSEIAIHETE
ncbi:unnamed protein product [Trifolium pratense]|uniref:Uncharacterized protein n=1 Tax=Trifolium pratense TaxID=57577 RepID=A0ACB0LXI1_TRIPR|nr:unnamed protein product [Trifolium pratense]